MLFASERTWKHHFVTVVLPYAFLVSRLWPLPTSRLRKGAIAAGLVLSAFLMACTSNDFGYLFGKNGHKVAQFYGFFFLAGVVLYVLTAWNVMAERRVIQEPAAKGPPAPHFAGSASRDRKMS